MCWKRYPNFNKDLAYMYICIYTFIFKNACAHTQTTVYDSF